MPSRIDAASREDDTIDDDDGDDHDDGDDGDDDGNDDGAYDGRTHFINIATVKKSLKRPLGS